MHQPVTGTTQAADPTREIDSGGGQLHRAATGLVIETLITLTGHTYVPAYYLMGAGLIGLIPVMLMPETSQVPMTSIEP
jgi:hypothetical protein